LEQRVKKASQVLQVHRVHLGLKDLLARQVLLDLLRPRPVVKARFGLCVQIAKRQYVEPSATRTRYWSPHTVARADVL
jgi:hypothetical protein